MVEEKKTGNNNNNQFHNNDNTNNNDNNNTNAAGNGNNNTMKTPWQITTTMIFFIFGFLHDMDNTTIARGGVRDILTKEQEVGQVERGTEM